MSVLVFVVGLCAGSFLNVCIYRLPAGESVVSPPSRCPSCGHQLTALDMIPVLSHLFLRGRCRWCGARVSARYSLVEALTGLLFFLSWLEFGWSLDFGLAIVFCSVLVTITFTDLDEQIIPDEALLTGLILGLILTGAQGLRPLALNLAAGLGAGTLLLLVAVVSKGGMGYGDVKLAALLGLYLGPAATAVALFAAVMAGGAAAFGLLAAGKKGRKDPIPFGPFLALGGITALFWGTLILRWYTGLWS